MRYLLYRLCFLVLAGCGSGANVVAVTPVTADTRGTYRLAASTLSTVAPDGVLTPFNSYSSGTLRLSDTSYARTTSDGGESISSGSYQLGTSVNTILNSRQGSFALTSTEPPFSFTGKYQVSPQFTLTLNYDVYAVSDLGRISRTETWIKESDSAPH